MSGQREILFRAKRLSKGPWMYGYYCENCNSKQGVIYSQDNVNDYQIVDTATVGQYTGLRDKFGKRIFEGDILHGHIDCLSAEPDRIGCVEWGNYGWIISFNQPEWRIPRVGFGSFADYEVIGNIHDNPELMEETE